MTNDLLTSSDKRWLLGALGAGVAGFFVAGPIGAAVGAAGTFGVHKVLGAKAAAAANAAATQQMAIDRARAAAQGKKP